MHRPRQGRQLFAPSAPISGRTSWVLFALLAGTGGFIVLLYLGIIPWRSSGRCRAVFCDPYHWQVLCFGTTFLLAGLAFIIPQRHRVLGSACSVGFIVSLLSAIVGTFAAT